MNDDISVKYGNYPVEASYGVTDVNKIGENGLTIDNVTSSDYNADATKENEFVDIQLDDESELEELTKECNNMLLKIYELYNEISIETDKKSSLEKRLSLVNKDDSYTRTQLQGDIDAIEININSINQSIALYTQEYTSLNQKITELSNKISTASLNAAVENNNNESPAPDNDLTVSDTSYDNIESSGIAQGAETSSSSTSAVNSADNSTPSASSNSTTPVNNSTPSAPYSGAIPADLAERLNSDPNLGKNFAQKCESVANALGCDPNDLLAMMYSESGLDPHVQNSIGATGLIQFLPSVLTGNGYSVIEVKNMTGEQQLDVVKDILSKSKAMSGYSTSDKIDAGTLYALCFLPAVAKNNTLCTQTDGLSWAYNSNSALDLDADGAITKSDLSKQLSKKLDLLKTNYKK